jgi:hypothetical protein
MITPNSDKVTTDELNNERCVQLRIMAATTEKIAIASRLFINGCQVGTNNAFMDYFASIKAAVAYSRAYFEAEGYTVESITIKRLPRWEHTDLVPTMVI